MLHTRSIASFLSLWLILPLAALALCSTPCLAQMLPEENPPVLERDLPSPVIDLPESRRAAPVEWTYHKTADDQHPDGLEQQQVWLMNNARSDPPREGEWLATLDDPDVVNAVTYFNVDLDMLRAEFNAYPPQPPAAFDVRLYNAAYDHNLYMISLDIQSHTGQSARVDAAGFVWNRLGLSVYSYTKNGVYGHAGFNIDWGYGTGGMQDGRGHRMNTMSIKTSYGNLLPGDFYNVGVSVVPENNANTRVGPLVVTENFARAYTVQPDHYNRFIVGTVWYDDNSNGYYDSGEGIGSVTVTPVGASFHAVSPPSGGFAMPITSSGWYDINFTGSNLTFPITRTVYVDSVSVLIDMPMGPDTDNDDLLDSYEWTHFNALNVTDGSGDQDQDGLNDADEYRYLTDPNEEDSDHDLMPDGWELTYSLNPLADDSAEDPDQDNISNIEEFWNGSNPIVYTPPNPGDLNNNGRLDFEDALFSLQVHAGFHGPSQYPLYDMNGDQKVDYADSILILKELAGVP